METTQSYSARPSTSARFSFDPNPHGEGGFGRVIRGRDNVLERNIAVKVLNPLVTQFGEAEQERFRREARILANLSHPNIPAIYDVSFAGGEFLIVFQFIEGRTLRKIVEEEGPASLEKVQRWFRQIASALDHAHSRGIVHRDVKPDNIIVTPDGETAYLVDFGIALSQQEAKKLTDSGVWIGTPGYMSPEQQAGDEVDARADVYSLGVTLYEALAGRRLAPGQYEELAVMNQTLPPQMDELIRACLEPKSLRLESAKAFATRLASALVPIRPLSEVLGSGRLHEIALALRDLTPDGFVHLPAGQRALILVKLDDIVSSDDPDLQYAVAQFLELLVTRALLLPATEYVHVAAPAVEWGYQRMIVGRQGSSSLREAVSDAARQARADQHEVLSRAVIAFLKQQDLERQPQWYLHALRELLQTLLANPVCSSDAAALSDALRAVNRSQRARSSPYAGATSEQAK